MCNRCIDSDEGRELRSRWNWGEGERRVLRQRANRRCRRQTRMLCRQLTRLCAG